MSASLTLMQEHIGEDLLSDAHAKVQEEGLPGREAAGCPERVERVTEEGYIDLVNVSGEVFELVVRCLTGTQEVEVIVGPSSANDDQKEGHVIPNVGFDEAIEGAIACDYLEYGEGLYIFTKGLFLGLNEFLLGPLRHNSRALLRSVVQDMLPPGGATVEMIENNVLVDAKLLYEEVRQGYKLLPQAYFCPPSFKAMGSDMSGDLLTALANMPPHITTRTLLGGDLEEGKEMLCPLPLLILYGRVHSLKDTQYESLLQDGCFMDIWRAYYGAFIEKSNGESEWGGGNISAEPIWPKQFLHILIEKQEEFEYFDKYFQAMLDVFSYYSRHLFFSSLSDVNMDMEKHMEKEERKEQKREEQTNERAEDKNEGEGQEKDEGEEEVERGHEVIKREEKGLDCEVKRENGESVLEAGKDISNDAYPNMLAVFEFFQCGEIINFLLPTPHFTNLTALSLRGCSSVNERVLQCCIPWWGQAGMHDLDLAGVPLNIRSLLLLSVYLGPSLRRFQIGGLDHLTEEEFEMFLRSLRGYEHEISDVRRDYFEEAIKASTFSGNLRKTTELSSKQVLVTSCALTQLNIQGCRLLGNNALTAIAQHLPGLRNLCIHGNYRMTDDGLLSAICGSRAASARDRLVHTGSFLSLERFNSCGCYKITDAGRRYLLNTFPSIVFYNDAREF
eukprot:Nk52_evm87s485 gene=Nk52_evmTU87s485